MNENLLSVVSTVVGKVTVLMLSAISLAWLLRSRPASHRAAAWQAALTAALLLPPLSFLLPSWRIALPVSPDSPPLPAFAFAAASAGSHTAESQLLFSVWALGFLFVAARIAIGNWMVWRAAKAGTRRDGIRTPEGDELPVIESSRIHTPLLWGVTNAQILVPVGWETRSAVERSLVLAHEVAHASRQDSLFQFFAQFASAIYWFHPLIWIAVARLRRESEMACDDAVLRSGVLASSYAGLLLRAASSFRMNAAVAPVTLAMARPSQIQSRIQSVLETGVRRSPLSRRGAALAGVLLLAIILPVAAMQSGTDDDRVYKISAGIVPPRPIEKREPAYTQEARDARIEGTVVLRVEIDKEGRIRRADLVRGLDPGLDLNALDAARTWRFDPARKAGKPVILRALIEVYFRFL